MQLGMRDGRPMQLGLEHRSLHDGALDKKGLILYSGERKWLQPLPTHHSPLTTHHSTLSISRVDPSQAAPSTTRRALSGVGACSVMASRSAT